VKWEFEMFFTFFFWVGKGMELEGWKDSKEWKEWDKDLMPGWRATYVYE